MRDVVKDNQCAGGLEGQEETVTQGVATLTAGCHREEARARFSRPGSGPGGKLLSLPFVC
jgi:hypothetical protein